MRGECSGVWKAERESILHSQLLRAKTNGRSMSKADVEWMQTRVSLES